MQSFNQGAGMLEVGMSGSVLLGIEYTINYTIDNAITVPKLVVSVICLL